MPARGGRHTGRASSSPCRWRSAASTLVLVATFVGCSSGDDETSIETLAEPPPSTTTTAVTATTATTAPASRFEPIEPTADFLGCLGRELETRFDDLSFEALNEQDGVRSLIEALPDESPAELVAAAEEAIVDCEGLDEMNDQLLAQTQADFGFSPEVTACAADQSGVDAMATNLAVNLVYGLESPQSRERAGLVVAAMLRCGLTDIEATLQDAGAPQEFIDCSLESAMATIEAVEADPASHTELTDEAANSVGGVRCRGVLPPYSPIGGATMTDGAPFFEAAVADELVAVSGGDLDTTAAPCVARELVGALALPDSSAVTAAQVAAYLEGAFSAAEIGSSLSPDAAQALSAAVVSCAGAQVLRRTTLSDGNLFDALGRPEEDPGPAVAQLPACALEAVGTDELATHLAEQFVVGPPSWSGATGRALISASFEAAQRCADELGIPRLEAQP